MYNVCFDKVILQSFIFSNKLKENKNMKKTEKMYKVGTYPTKTPRKKRLRKMCNVCSKCSNRKYCNNRKDISLMKKCNNCKNCNNKDNCDVFYIGVQHRITIPIYDERTGETIRKTFSGKTENEAVYNAEKYKKDVKSGKVTPRVKKTTDTIVSIIEDDEITKNNIGETNDNTYNTNMCTLARIRQNEWANGPILNVTREDIEGFLYSERMKGQSNSVLKKDSHMLQRAFSIAKYRNLVNENFFDGPYGIKTPKSIKEDMKTQAFSVEENMILLRYLYQHNVTHKYEYLLAMHTRYESR